MNRSNQSLLVFVGAAAILALGAGCSRTQSHHARSAQRGTTPTFESAVPEGQRDQYGQPSQGQVTQGQVGTSTGGMGEREVCSSLADHGDLRVDNVEGGVAIIATPKSGVEQSKIREDALHLTYMLTPPPDKQAHQRPTSASDRCQLFDLGTIAGRSSVVEQGNEVRIIILARDAADVATLRSEARTFASQWNKP